MHDNDKKEDEKYGVDYGRLGTCFAYARGGDKFVMPLKKCRFYDTTVYCPNDTDGYLHAGMY